MEPYPHSCSQLASVINFISLNLSLSGYENRQIKFRRIYIKNLADIDLEASTVYIELPNKTCILLPDIISLQNQTRVFAFISCCLYSR